MCVYMRTSHNHELPRWCLIRFSTLECGSFPQFRAPPKMFMVVTQGQLEQHRSNAIPCVLELQSCIRYIHVVCLAYRARHVPRHPIALHHVSHNRRGGSSERAGGGYSSEENQGAQVWHIVGKHKVPQLDDYGLPVQDPSRT